MFNSKQKPLSKAKIDKIVKELAEGARDCPELGTAGLFDVADGVLFEEDGLKEGIRLHYRATDEIGWLVNQIC